jgi:hypothetical protein
LAVTAILAGLAAGSAEAQQPRDKRTYFTFSGPVAVPGVTLPGGRYLFRVVDTSGRNVIQVLSDDGRMSYAMFFGFRAERSDVPTQPEIRFMETAVDAPAAVDTWWYPGQRAGYEFVYPKDQARRLARGSGRAILTTAAETTTPPETGAAELSRISPAGQDVPIDEGEGPIGTTLYGEIAPPSLQFQAPALEARSDLPKTASSLPFAGIGALALLLGAAAIRGWRLTAR